MATSAPARPSWTSANTHTVASILCTLGGVMLAGEAAVHLQQYTSLFHGVDWIGPVFLANAAASVAAIAGLVHPRTRPLAALFGVVLSALSLGSLVVSYGHGLFGWQEAGFRTPVALAVITEVGAVILLSMALTARMASGQARYGQRQRSRNVPEGVQPHRS
jgi:hypothetical protein